MTHAKTEHYPKGTFPGSVSGTYLNADLAPPWREARFDWPPDLRYSVLYLLPSGHFAWFDYWPGFHYGRHAGRFLRNGGTLDLNGQDSVLCDVPNQNYSHKSFHKQVTLRHVEGKRVLEGLSHKEHVFIGRIYIPFDDRGGDMFPQSWQELQGWIEDFLGTRGR